MLCDNKENYLELHELEAVVGLYSSICSSRLRKGKPEKNEVLHLGLVTLHLTQAISSVQHELYILPRLIYLLVNDCSYEEVSSLLERLGNNH